MTYIFPTLISANKFMNNIPQIKFWQKCVDRYGMLSSGGIGKKVSHFLSTGNIISSTGLDLMQVSGYTIVAEKLNFLRFCAHFRSVHRGSFVSTILALVILMYFWQMYSITLHSMHV